MRSRAPTFTEQSRQQSSEPNGQLPVQLHTKFKDNRSEAIRLKAVRAVINESPRTASLKAMQTVMNAGLQPQQPRVAQTVTGTRDQEKQQ